MRLPFLSFVFLFFPFFSFLFLSLLFLSILSISTLSSLHIMDIPRPLHRPTDRLFRFPSFLFPMVVPSFLNIQSSIHCGGVGWWVSWANETEKRKNSIYTLRGKHPNTYPIPIFPRRQSSSRDNTIHSMCACINQSIHYRTFDYCQSTALYIRAQSSQ